MLRYGMGRSGAQHCAGKRTADQKVAEAGLLAKAKVTAAKKAADMLLEEALLGESAFTEARGGG